jgi:16S rRNA processing protein RimM
LSNSAANRDMVLIGEIVGVHGITGASKLHSYCESLGLFKPGQCVLIATADGSESSYEIDWVKPHTKTVLLSFKGVTNRNQAEALIGSSVYVDAAALPKLEGGSYYWRDLIGMNVYTDENEYIGRLKSIVETGSNDVYVIKGEQKEILIPALESVILTVDIEHKVMRVNLPEGLR